MSRVVGVQRRYPLSHMHSSEGPEAETSICAEALQPQSPRFCLERPRAQRSGCDGLEPREELEGWGLDSESMLGCDVLEDEGDRASIVFSTCARRSTAPTYVECQATVSIRASAGRLDQSSSTTRTDDDVGPNLTVALSCTEDVVAAENEGAKGSSESYGNVAESAQKAMATASFHKVEALGSPKYEAKAAMDHEHNSEVVNVFSRRRCSATRRGRSVSRSVHHFSGIPHAPPPIDNEVDSFGCALTPDTTKFVPTAPVLPRTRPKRPASRAVVLAAAPGL